MANHLAIHSFSQSLADHLAQSYATFVPDPGTNSLPVVTFDVLSSSQFNTPETDVKEKVTIYLHRIALNNHLRNRRPGRETGPIGLDLHYLLTIWVDTAEQEQVLMGWAIRELHQHAFLDRSSLSAAAGWGVDEAISLVPAELSAEEMSRIWETARRGYRLSFPFLARIVRIERQSADETTPAVARRFGFTDELEEHRR